MQILKYDISQISAKYKWKFVVTHALQTNIIKPSDKENRIKITRLLSIDALVFAVTSQCWDSSQVRACGSIAQMNG